MEAYETVKLIREERENCSLHSPGVWCAQGGKAIRASGFILHGEDTF